MGTRGTQAGLLGGCGRRFDSKVRGVYSEDPRDSSSLCRSQGVGQVRVCVCDTSTFPRGGATPNVACGRRLVRSSLEVRSGDCTERAASGERSRVVERRGASGVSRKRRVESHSSADRNGVCNLRSVRTYAAPPISPKRMV